MTVMTAERLQELINLVGDPTPLGQLTYIDDLMTATALWTQRPGEVDRVAWVLDTLIREVSAWRTAGTRGTERPTERSHGPEQDDNAKVGVYGPERLTGERTA